MLVLRIWSDVSLTNTYTLFFYKKPRDPLSPFETFMGFLISVTLILTLTLNLFMGFTQYEGITFSY